MFHAQKILRIGVVVFAIVCYTESEADPLEISYGGSGGSGGVEGSYGISFTGSFGGGQAGESGGGLGGGLSGGSGSGSSGVGIGGGIGGGSTGVSSGGGLGGGLSGGSGSGSSGGGIGGGSGGGSGFGSKTSSGGSSSLEISGGISALVTGIVTTITNTIFGEKLAQKIIASTSIGLRPAIYNLLQGILVPLSLTVDWYVDILTNLCENITDVLNSIGKELTILELGIYNFAGKIAVTIINAVGNIVKMIPIIGEKLGCVTDKASFCISDCTRIDRSVGSQLAKCVMNPVDQILLTVKAVLRFVRDILLTQVQFVHHKFKICTSATDFLCKIDAIVTSLKNIFGTLIAHAPKLAYNGVQTGIKLALTMPCIATTVPSVETANVVGGIGVNIVKCLITH